jgi:hypothetical protein
MKSMYTVPAMRPRNWYCYRLYKRHDNSADNIQDRETSKDYTQKEILVPILQYKDTGADY